MVAARGQAGERRLKEYLDRANREMTLYYIPISSIAFVEELN